MPEQQKVDDVVESTSITDRKKITKLEKSSTALEKDQDNDAASMDVDVDDQDNAAGVEVDDLKE